MTAISADGQRASASIAYTVVAAPAVTITAPSHGARYVQDQIVRASYARAAAQGARIRTCTGPVASGQPINTHTLGGHDFTVTATDTLGATSSRSASYTVPAAAPVITRVRQAAARWRAGRTLPQISPDRRYASVRYPPRAPSSSPPSAPLWD